MADVEMEVDMNRPLGPDGQPDEDLIDYDTDMADQPETEWSNSGGTGNLHSTGFNDEHGMENFENKEYHDLLGQTNEVVDVDHNRTDNVEPSMDDATNLANSDYIDATDDVEAPKGEDHNYVEVINTIDGDGHPAGDDDHASAHEIDYEHDANEQEELQDELDAGGGGNMLGDDAEGVNDGDDGEANPKSEADMPAAEDSHDPDHTAEVELAEQDEITWNTYEGQESNEGAEEEEQNGAEASVEADASDQHHEDIEVNDEETSHDQEGDFEESGHHEDLSHDAESDEHQGVGEEYEEHQESAVSQQGDHSASREESTAASDLEFPAITVQYKGDEFPFFSTATEGFFTEASCLDDNMETLLAKLREELANEIAHEDELVFQVDELGLEFAEASICPNATLRQILEIFDLLVKNQDPDSSRTLYTYLFTKPSTSKRLESLIDSATAGKGLDEVIHLFESPMPNSTGMLEASSMAQGLDEQLDEYETPADEIIESNYLELEHGDDDVTKDEEDLDTADTQAGADGDQNDTAVQYDEGTEVEEHEVERAIETDGHAPDGTSILEAAESNGKSVASTSHPFSCFHPTFCLCPICVAEYAADHDQVEGNFRRILYFQQVLGNTEARHPGSSNLSSAFSSHLRTNSDFSIAFSDPNTDTFSQAPTDNESNTFVNLDLDDTVEVDGDDVELGQLDVTEDYDAHETDAVNPATATTSTTNTLRDDDDTASINVDTGAEGVTENEAKNTNPPADDDELAEIDWRDEPEADHEAPDSPSGTGKRARTYDDELGAEDEKDVKRRRP
ncbi:Fc.00g076350.m01.CDS01 [Cosmosporella sp. VM-42]